MKVTNTELLGLTGLQISLRFTHNMLTWDPLE